MFSTRTRLLVVAVLPAAGLGAVVPAGASALTNAPLVRVVNSTSTNWSGYASTAGPFTSVSASWVQPSGTCSSPTTYSSFWVGLDGDGSNSVEQTGTEADCRGGSPVYFGWYEMYPKFPVNYTNPVHPGDVLTASVTATTAGTFTITLTDTTQGWTQTQHKTRAKSKRHSAEVIAEAPSSGSTVLPLANFGTVAFSSSLANGTPIGNHSPDEITMASGSTIKAQPTALTSGENFSVVWRHS